MIAEGARRAGCKIVCVGLAGSVDPSLVKEVDFFYKVSVARPGGWLRKFKKHDVAVAIMVGRVAKEQIFTPFRILRYLPDWRALRIWYLRLRTANKQNDSLLSALADELAEAGVIVEDSTMYCKEHLACEGLMTKCQAGGSVKEDIHFGWEIAKKLGELDIGQAVTVKEKEVIAVEAIEGTARMIQRTAEVCKSGGWTLIKVSKPNQDMRFDVPCVGPDTIKDMAKSGAACLVVEADKTIIIDKPQTIEIADKLGLAIIGI